MKNRNNGNRHNAHRTFRTAGIRALLLLAVIIVNLLAVPAGLAGSGAYNQQPYGDLQELPAYGTAAYINYPYCYASYIKPQCGPGYEYQVFRSMNGSKHLYNPEEITRADIYFTVDGWSYVGFGYSDGKWRYGFFNSSVFMPYEGWEDVPEVSLDYGWYGTITQKTTPYNGPGWDSGEYSSCRLQKGDSVFACMQSNGWYLCRFYNNHSNKYGYIYLWVPGTSISW